jgi:hypothetical protein
LDGGFAVGFGSEGCEASTFDLWSATPGTGAFSSGKGKRLDRSIGRKTPAPDFSASCTGTG